MRFAHGIVNCNLLCFYRFLGLKVFIILLCNLECLHINIIKIAIVYYFTGRSRSGKSVEAAPGTEAAATGASAVCIAIFKGNIFEGTCYK